MKVLRRFVLIFLLAAVVAGVFFYIRGATMNPLIVTYNGAAVDHLTGVTVSGADPIVLQLDTAGKDYSYSVKPCAGVDFTYTAAGFEYKFSDLQDCTAGFDVVMETNGKMTVKPRGNIVQIISLIHNGADVVVDDTAINYDNDLFTLEISNGGQSWTVDCGLYLYSVSGVTMFGKVVF